MAGLRTLALGTTANADHVTGTSAAGNDQQIYDLLYQNKVTHRHKRHRWGLRTVNRIMRGVAHSTGIESGFIYGIAEVGLWVKNVAIHIHRAGSNAKVDTNYVTVTMYKEPTAAAGGARDVSNDDELGIPSSNAIYLVPETKVRSWQGKDDGYLLSNTGFVSMPIENGYIAPGEIWALRAQPNAVSGYGWTEAYVTITFAELHRE